MGLTSLFKGNNYDDDYQRDTQRVVCCKPETLDDSHVICDELLNGACVVINLENAKASEGQRIMDFVAGACYAVDGNLRQVAAKNFIITPHNMTLSGDFPIEPDMPDEML